MSAQRIVQTKQLQNSFETIVFQPKQNASAVTAQFVSVSAQGAGIKANDRRLRWHNLLGHLARTCFVVNHLEQGNRYLLFSCFTTTTPTFHMSVTCSWNGLTCSPNHKSNSLGHPRLLQYDVLASVLQRISSVYKYNTFHNYCALCACMWLLYRKKTACILPNVV